MRNIAYAIAIVAFMMGCIFSPSDEIQTLCFFAAAGSLLCIGEKSK